MPIVKNILRRGKLTKQNLDTFDVFVDEKGVVGSLATSEYFKISNVPSDFVRGNQFFQLEGSDLLKPEVELKTEILDSEGNPIFHYAKLKRLNERLTSIVVEIYEDVAPGQGKLILLGELNPERVNVPTEFLNTYNVRFSAPINIDVEKSNTQPIRFFGSPRLDVKENVKGIVKEKPQQSIYEEFTYTISGSGALSDDGVGFREFFEWIDAPNPIGFTSGSGFDDFSDNLADIKNFQSKLNSSNFNDQEKQNKKKIKSYYSVDPVPPSFIASSISNGPGVNDNKFNLTIETGKLKLLNPHLSVNNTDFPDDEYDKPTTFETSFKVGNSSQLLIGSGYKIIRKSDGKRASVPLSSVNYELTYEQVITSKTEDPDYFRSYADITVGNLRTFSGDVYRTKIFSNPRGSIGDSELIADVVLESQQQLVDKDSLSGRENIGIFYSQSIVDNYWISSSEGVATQNDDIIAGSVILSGSVKPYDSSMTFITSQSYDLVRDEDYIVEFDGYFFKSDSNDSSGNTTPDAELEVFLTGSAISSQIQEFSLGTIDNQSTLLKNRVSGSLNGIYNTFKTHNELSIPNTKLGFRLKKGKFALQNVVLRPFADTNFNPGFFKTSVPMPQVIKRGQRYDFTAKFYDINNNEADGVLAHTTQSIIFNGPPQVIADGLDAKLSGSMLIGESLEMYGVNPAYLRSVGYDGFDNTISNNKGGFMLFSGSVGTRITASESYEGVGLEIVDAHSDIDRYLKFRTNPSQFEVVTDTFFFGREGQFISGSGGTIAISSSNFFLGDSNGAFISGSQGNLQISSSNFSVDVDGNVTMSGFVSASGGHIGNFQIVEGKISGSNITMDANTSTIFKTDQGPGSDTSAPFDQLRDEYYIDFTPTEEAPDNYYIKFGPNFMVDKDGILIASGATFEGSITASTGLIGGFTIGSASLFNGSEGTPNFFFSGSANGSNFDKGNLFISSSGFQVNSQGAISASSGQIGGFNINTDGLNSDSNEFQITGSTGQVTGSQVLFTGGKIGGFEIVSSVDAIRSTDKSLILSGSGQITGSTVLFTGGKVGGWTLSNNTISSNNLIIDSSGLIETSNFVSGLRGFRLSAENNGFLEVEQAKIRGTLATTVFEKESINSVGGQLIVANSTTITGSNEVSASQVTMSVANVTGFEQNEILILKKVSGTGFNTEYVLVNSSSRDGTNDNDTQGRIMVTRGYGTSETFNGAKHSGSISEVANNATTYEPGQVIVSTGKIDTGYIRLNANPNDATTPYIDIVERTGSGIFDVDLKARLGDLSGLSSGLVGSNPGFGLFSENVFLTGKITSNEGAIGGWTLSANDLSSGNVSFNSNTERLKLGAVTDFAKDGSDKGILIGKDGSDYEFFVGQENGNQIHWNGSTLSITGDITVSNPEDFIQPSETGSFTKNSATSSLENPTDYSFGGDATFPLNALPGTITTAGLYLGSNNLGYHDGSVYKTYMDSSGRFYLGGTSGALQWDGANLSINGTITLNASSDLSATDFYSDVNATTGSLESFSGSMNTRTGSLDTLETRVVINNDGMTLRNNSDVTIANFSSSIILGTTGSNEENIRIDSDSVDVRSGTTVLSSFGTTTTIGQTSGNHISIDSDSIDIIDSNGVTRLSASAAGLEMAGTIKASGGTIGGWDINSTNIEKDGVRLNAGSNNGYLGIGVTSYNTNNGIWIGETSSGLYQMSLKNSGGTKFFKWDGTNLEVDAGNFSINSSGNITATSVDLTGEINATTGVIGGWNISGTTLESNDQSIVLDEGNNRIDIVGTTTVGGSSVDTKIRLDADAGKGSEIALQRDDFGGSLINFVELHTSQSYFENTITSYSSGSTRDDVSYTLDANNSETITMAGNTTWGTGVVYLRSDGSTLNDVVVESAISAGQLLSTGEANLITEIQLRNLTERANASGTGKSLFRWKGEIFQNSVNSTTGAELVGSFRVSSTLNIGAAASAINIQDKFLLTKQFFYVKFSGVEFDILTASGTSNDDWTLAATASPIAAVKYLPKVVTSGIGQQFAAGPNQEAKFGAQNQIIGSYRIRQTTADTEGNISIEGKASIGTPDIDDTFDLFVDGAIGATGNIVGYYSSDERLKENIIEIKEGLSLINQLRPVKFDWKQDSPFGHLYPTEYGLIAQEVEEVVPEIVGTMKDNYKGINYESLVPLLIQSIKELTSRVEELEQKNHKIEVD